jgi:nitrilase
MTNQNPSRAAPATTVCVAAVQLVSGSTVQDNLDNASRQIDAAVAQGAQVIALPEYFCLMGNKDTDKLALAEPIGDGPLQRFLANEAQRHGIWLIGGTIPIRSPDPSRVYNTLLIHQPDGRCMARYDKIHLFAFQRGPENYDEARSIMPGDQVRHVELPIPGLARPLRVGLSVCYDLRFPEMYRRMGAVDLHVVPAAFTATTGAAHWHALLRARAIENLCYVLASAQGGHHDNGRNTYGHSMFVSPWGEVGGCLPQGPGVVMGHIDPAFLTECRTQLPALDHRVL